MARTDRPSSRHHIWVYDEDWEFLQQYYGPGSTSQIGASQACRVILHSYIARVKEKANQKLSETSK